MRGAASAITLDATVQSVAARTFDARGGSRFAHAAGAFVAEACRVGALIFGHVRDRWVALERHSNAVPQQTQVRVTEAFAHFADAATAAVAGTRTVVRQP